MMRNEISEIIYKLGNKELSIGEVPEEVKYQKDIVIAERKYGLRKELNRGYDAIHDFFFIEEEIRDEKAFGKSETYRNRLIFDSIEEYYDYLNGDIYDYACYKYCDFDRYKEFIKDKNIDINRLKARNTFLNKTIKEVTLDISEEEREAYDKAESIKKLIKIWIKEFDGCKSGNDFDEIVKRYEKSELKDFLEVSFFFYYYIFEDIKDINRFNALMEYMCMGKYPEYRIVKVLCLIYGTETVIEKFNYSGGTKRTNYNHIKKVKDYITILDSKKVHFLTRYYYDKRIHFYCEEVEGIKDGEREGIVSYHRYFDTFESFIAYRKGNLRGVDISEAKMLKVDISLYEIDEKTKLPICLMNDLVCKIEKKYEKEKFVVVKKWVNQKDEIIKAVNFTTNYFFDFVYYLDGDLSNAFLLFCDGLENLKDYDDLDFSGVMLTSKLCEKFGLPYERYNINESMIESFIDAEKNESKTVPAIKGKAAGITFNNANEYSIYESDKCDKNNQKIYYITDIHLMHRLEAMNCRSRVDIIYVLQKIIDSIVDEGDNFLLIGGDVSSDFSIFKSFVKLLGKKMKYKARVVFVLGNHELWEFPGKSIDEIVEIYRKVIEENGMYLVHNELLYMDSYNRICKIPYKKLMSLTEKELRQETQSARLAILGGIGFSGYNKDFNADQGIYRMVLDRAREIAETAKFEKLYDKVAPVIYDKNTIIVTHMPKKDWSVNEKRYKDFVYVSGHNHRNEFYDDGTYRIYSDNQVGYKNVGIHLKNFLIGNKYDFFSDYDDGIYEITGEQYNDFYRGKNIYMNFTRKVNVLYMLKKKGYYCFIHKTKTGVLSILHGGSLKHLDKKDVKYYYEHMDEMVMNIEGPLEKYTHIQQKISEAIKKIGGDGTIHGCIVDIDWYTHIYVNPVDLAVTGYCAMDMVNKYVYPDVPTMLQIECPDIYENYLQLLDKENPFALIKEKKEIGILPQEYLKTDIYRVSREIKKMQRLTSNILTTWDAEVVQENKFLPN
ncbi:MAG: metallophosphoesterase [Lachnospiraceae bacterium]|nr:metallophosphoesterase [Lachnospiraceae bacterium]